MLYSLPPTVELSIIGNTVYLISREIVALENCNQGTITALKKLKDGIKKTALKNILGEDYKNLLTTLQNLNLLKVDYSNLYENNLAEKQVYYFDGLHKFPNTLQKSLGSKNVCILGMGGVGSIVFQHLIGAGIKSFILIDSDNVEISNFNRQYIYNSSQIGKPKVLCAKEYAYNIDPNIKVNSMNAFINQTSDLNFLNDYQIDFFVCAADLPVHKIQHIVNQHCLKNFIPFSMASVGLQCGSWGPLIVPNKTKCYDCFCQEEDKTMLETELEIRKGVQTVTKASFGPTNTISSALLSNDIIHYLAEQDNIPTMNTRLCFNFQNMQTTQFSAKPGACTCNQNMKRAS